MARDDVGVDKVAEMLGHNMTPHRAGKIAAMDDSVEGSQVSSAASEISCIDLSTIKPQKLTGFGIHTFLAAWSAC